MLSTGCCCQKPLVRSNLHDAGPLTNNHDSLHPHPGATASRFKCHCLFDTFIFLSGLIYASFALSPQFSHCLISVQLLRGAIQSTVPRNIFRILTKPAQCHLPKKKQCKIPLAVFFFFSALGLIYHQQHSLTPVALLHQFRTCPECMQKYAFV